MQQAPAKGINLNLEALRGFAALFVVLNHIEALHNAFNPTYLPTATIVLAPNGRLFVLVFFVLSGYVIGLNHNRPMLGSQTSRYLCKRLLRIYPIYFIALALTLIISQQKYITGVILANFFMLHVLLAPPFLENGPAWSLHYEMVFYGLFVFISRFKVNTPLLILISVVLALGKGGIISSYFLGLSFWLSGLFIAQRFTKDKPNVNYSRLFAGILLLLAFDQLLARPGIPLIIDYLTYQLPGLAALNNAAQVSPLANEGHDLIYLPIYAFIVIIFSGRQWRFERLCFVLLNVLIVGAILLTLFKYLNGYTDHIKVYLISIGYYLLALLSWYSEGNLFNSIGKKFVRVGAWLGGISYALYMIHAPCIYLLGRVTFINQNEVLNYVLKLIALFAIIFPLSWFLEKRFQPAIKKMFFRTAPPAKDMQQII